MIIEFETRYSRLSAPWLEIMVCFYCPILHIRVRLVWSPRIIKLVTHEIYSLTFGTFHAKK